MTERGVLACTIGRGKYISKIFSVLVIYRLGCHPAIFKLVEVVLLARAGRDLSLVRDWSPRFFQSLLRNGLERAGTIRMFNSAII